MYSNESSLPEGDVLFTCDEEKREDVESDGPMGLEGVLRLMGRGWGGYGHDDVWEVEKEMFGVGVSGWGEGTVHCALLVEVRDSYSIVGHRRDDCFS
jgi:hypothetical protein